MNRISIFFALLIGLAIAGCNKDDDEPPFIESATLNGVAAGQDIEISPGSTITLNASFSDNKELSHFDADLHHNFDAHSHKTTAEPLVWSQRVGMSGKAQTENVQIDVGDASSGPYHLTLTCFDAADFESQTIVFDFDIVSASQPVVTITTPALSPVPTYGYNDTIHVAGMAEDELGIASIFVAVKPVQMSGGLSAGTIIYEKEFAVGGSPTTWNFDAIANQNEWIIVPTATALGDYALTVVATDVDGNRSVQSVPIKVQ